LATGRCRTGSIRVRGCVIELACGSTVLLAVLAGLVVVALLAGAVVLVKLGVLALLALREQPQDQREQVYTLDQSREAGSNKPASDS
jgi:hypothetical protein